MAKAQPIEKIARNESEQAQAEPPRRDSVKCPRCGGWGCPAVGGSKISVVGTRRYRRCSGCAHTFVTIQSHGGQEREET